MFSFIGRRYCGINESSCLIDEGVYTHLNVKLYIGSVTSDTSHDSPLKEMESNYNLSLSCWCQHRYMCMLHFGLPQKSGKGIVVKG